MGCGISDGSSVVAVAKKATVPVTAAASSAASPTGSSAGVQSPKRSHTTASDADLAQQLQADEDEKVARRIQATAGDRNDPQNTLGRPKPPSEPPGAGAGQFVGIKACIRSVVSSCRKNTCFYSVPVFGRSEGRGAVGR